LQYYRATVAYDGTDFLGFQLQVFGRTVQGVLEEALLRLTGVETRAVASGRTDAGVHAAGQVVGFRTPWRHTTAGLHRALNAVLPADVAVSDLAEAPDEWHPRFSALWRHYRYTVLNAEWRDPIARRYALHLSRSLQLEQLQAAAQVLVGEHDFASFGRPMQEGETTVRAIFTAGWQRDGETLTFDVIGNAFLRGMVRSLVGSMLQVGLGEWPVERLAEVLAARSRSSAGGNTGAARPAAACGLCLMHVEYDVPRAEAVVRERGV
jgi:tRNA pseudouridine38-40 synthase